MRNKELFIWIFVVFLASCKGEGAEADQGEDRIIAADTIVEPAFTLLTEPELKLGERIDGPANVRDTIDGEILFSIEDWQWVEVSEYQENEDWFYIGAWISLTKEQHKKAVLQKGDQVINDGILILTAESDYRPAHMGYGDENDSLEWYTYFAEGYTHKQNIRPESVPERELERILENGDLSKGALQPFMDNFQFREANWDIRKWEHLEQYQIMGSFVDDPSPIDRLRLLFEDDELIAVIHERPLDIKSHIHIDLVRGMEMHLIKEMETGAGKNFIVANRNAYYGVD